MIYCVFKNFFTCKFQIQAHELSSAALVLPRYCWVLYRVQLLQIVWDCSDHFFQHEKLLHICNLHWILLSKEKKKKLRYNASLKTWKIFILLFIFKYNAFKANKQVTATNSFRKSITTFSHLFHTSPLWAQAWATSPAFPKLAIQHVFVRYLGLLTYH